MSHDASRLVLALISRSAGLERAWETTRESPENGLETRRALEIGPAYRESEGRCCRQSKQMLALRIITLITRTGFLIHGSAIKIHAKRPKVSNMQNSNR